MNSWRENAKMFVGFKAKNHKNVFDILGFKLRGEEKHFLGKYGGRGKWISCNVENCTLIARPISDMTDEDIRYVVETDSYNKAFVLEILKANANTDQLYGRTERRLADRGIYFGPQSHFTLPDDDEAKVIDATKLEE